jgi:hypothetical protein
MPLGIRIIGVGDLIEFYARHDVLQAIAMRLSPAAGGAATS